MDTLSEMTGRFAQAGSVAWIGLRPVRQGEVRAVPAVEIGAGGLEGDHGRAGKRAATLIQAEHLAVIATLTSRDGVAPALLRRNIAVSGINLAALRGRRVAVGEAVLEITVPCAPCSRMEAALGPGGFNAMRGHGGWCAEVVKPGRVAVGDRVAPAD